MSFLFGVKFLFFILRLNFDVFFFLCNSGILFFFESSLCNLEIIKNVLEFFKI